VYTTFQSPYDSAVSAGLAAIYKTYIYTDLYVLYISDRIRLDRDADLDETDHIYTNCISPTGGAVPIGARARPS